MIIATKTTRPGLGILLGLALAAAAASLSTRNLTASGSVVPSAVSHASRCAWRGATTRIANEIERS